MRKEVVNIYEKKVEQFKGNAKKVSVIIPNYNYQDFIIERIDSIVNQSYPIYEIVILDDASTDNSVSVIEEKLNSIHHIPTKFIKNETNSGCVFKQWLKGLENITGDYFWIAEADDSADPLFLETAMKGFENERVVLSYTDSARIDENNQLIARNSQDLYNMCHIDKWDHPYINDGINEIKNTLSITNTILNVSSVVWKKKDYTEIFSQAASFKVAGDWYIYTKVLEDGDIAFSNLSLNYYRKHSNSVCTVVKADIEYGEIYRIQDMIATKYHLSMDIYKTQRLRRSYMDQNVSKNIRKKRIAWVIPYPGRGSGGHRTIIQNVNALIRHGYECDIYVEDNGISTSQQVAKEIDEYYETCAANVYSGIYLRCEYDLIFQTGWQVIDFVKSLESDLKGYFIQDYEPWFFPMGDKYIDIENSYRLGYKNITIGKWLSHKMMDEFNSPSQYFDFCADLNVYKPLDNVKKENAICYIFQPEKPRRCDVLALKALKLVKEIKKDVKIYVYGSNTDKPIDFEVERLGIIPIEKCNKLYNKCVVGLCMSASNPSRIPFEMMAAGLPVVELYRENNLYDFPDDAVLLAEPSCEGVATALIYLLENEEVRSCMSAAGIRYMKDYPLEKGYQQFLNAVDNVLNNNVNEIKNIDKLYKKSPVLPSDEVIKCSKELLKVTEEVRSDSDIKRKIRKIKRKIRSGLGKIKRRLMKFFH